MKLRSRKCHVPLMPQVPPAPGAPSASSRPSAREERLPGDSRVCIKGLNDQTHLCAPEIRTFQEISLVLFCCLFDFDAKLIVLQ